MKPSTLRILLLALTVALVPALAACGNRESKHTRSKTEGPYLDVGPLQYQVQISRQLNPADTEDRTYLTGLPAADAKLKPDETWFAVFVRVSNDTNHRLPAADDFSITDTQDKVFSPIALPASNVFAYQGGEVEPKSTLPPPDSVASDTSINGQLVLFKLNLTSLANRPLELRISGGGTGAEASVDLDI